MHKKQNYAVFKIYNYKKITNQKKILQLKESTVQNYTPHHDCDYNYVQIV